MARHPDCNLMVSYGEPEAELEDDDLEVHEDGSFTINGPVRVDLTCGDCGTALRSHTFDLDYSDELACQHKLDAATDNDDNPEYTLEVEPDERWQEKDNRGRPIKNARYRKHYYGYTWVFKIKCPTCEQESEYAGQDDEQSSAFEEC